MTQPPGAWARGRRWAETRLRVRSVARQPCPPGVDGQCFPFWARYHSCLPVLGARHLRQRSDDRGQGAIPVKGGERRTRHLYLPSDASRLTRVLFDRVVEESDFARTRAGERAPRLGAEQHVHPSGAGGRVVRTLPPATPMLLRDGHCDDAFHDGRHQCMLSDCAFRRVCGRTGPEVRCLTEHDVLVLAEHSLDQAGDPLLRGTVAGEVHREVCSAKRCAQRHTHRLERRGYDSEALHEAVLVPPRRLVVVRALVRAGLV